MLVPAGVKPNDRGDNKGRASDDDDTVEGIPGGDAPDPSKKAKGIGDGPPGNG